MTVEQIPIEYLTELEACGLYSAGDAAHDFDHVQRVTHLAQRIAQAEGADGTVVRLAALLHDVPAHQLDFVLNGNDDMDRIAARRAHHMAAAGFAHVFLRARGLGTMQLENVVHCIEAHRFRDQSIKPETLEAKCLYDADKLDSIGAIGVARAFAYGGAHGSRLWSEAWTAAPDSGERPTGANYTPVHEFVYKLRRLLDTLHTDTAKRIGRRRHDFMVVYFEQLDVEMQLHDV